MGIKFDEKIRSYPASENTPDPAEMNAKGGNWDVAAFDIASKKMVLATAHDIILSESNGPLVELELDEDKAKIQCHPTLQFMLGDESYKEAQNLVGGDELMTIRTPRFDNYSPLPGIKKKVVSVANIEDLADSYQMIVDDGGQLIYDNVALAVYNVIVKTS